MVRSPYFTKTNKAFKAASRRTRLRLIRDQQIVSEVEAKVAELKGRGVSDPLTEAAIAIGENHGLSYRHIQRICRDVHLHQQFIKRMRERELQRARRTPEDIEAERQRWAAELRWGAEVLRERRLMLKERRLKGHDTE
jgi:hypothetical protein